MHKLLGQICEKGQPNAMCIIIGQRGAAYRPLGSVMALYEDGTYLGNVSSGCIEADIIARCNDLKRPHVLTYGLGSKYMDLNLPCGGAMDLLILRNPDMTVLKSTLDRLDQRQSQAMSISIKSGTFSTSTHEKSGREKDLFHLYIEPSLNFCVFGNGCEAKVFAELVNGAGYDVTLYSNNDATITDANLPKGKSHLLPNLRIPPEVKIDHYTSIALFFHDHDLEHRILADAVKTPAFYIGAQGSKRTHTARIESLRAAGLSAQELSRIRGPIGLIPRVRDPQTLAISVLSEIHAVALATEG